MGIKVDLGCGANKVEGCVGVDIHRGHAPDIVADVRKPVRGLADGCAEFVVCRHVLEHLPGDEWRLVMTEVSRVLEVGGRFEVRVPHPSCENAMICGHVQVITPNYWQQLQSGAIKMRLPLAIDRVVEIPDPRFIEYCKANGWNLEEHGRFHFNAYFETAIFGHKL